ncbi:unnamed protein product [Hermetia illucens]|uniref:HTH psq-type domain-containing protein n=2 Tax=Hermetia illucens TaxID=343691 RepID=A0A7R8UNE4_HERIL|nr:unnamed protein product [Hermetia illucens]
MENSHAWLGASTSSIADSYQYQLQSMWQKCWNTNQNLMHHLRFRERGPLKSWRPETMAEAIFSVLKEGLSLSQAARKYDIPYPTFVLYANRVHNMLGPSIDGGTDLRPKGRGRPQRILLGIWPDDHIKGVIKTVVFRDAKDLKEDGMHLSYGRHSPVFPFQEGQMNYPGAACANGLPQQQASSNAETMTPEATAAAVAAVAHGIRQQMQMVAAAQHHPEAQAAGLFNLPPHMHTNNGGVPIPKQTSPASSSQRHTSPSIPGLSNTSAMGMSGIPGIHIMPGLGSNPSASTNSSYTSNASSQQAPPTLSAASAPSGSTNISRNNSPTEAAHDLRMNSPDESPLNSPLELALEPAVNLAVGVSGMAYKPSRGYSSPRPEHLFQEDITDLVGRTSRTSSMTNFKEPSGSIKVEPIAECRSE